jgi:hypothetical protein
VNHVYLYLYCIMYLVCFISTFFLFYFSAIQLDVKKNFLALGYVLRKKVKIKEEERQSMKCAEGTQTEEGSKWLKKQKRRNEVKEKQVIEREDQGRQSNKEDGSWTRSASGRRHQ